MQVPVTIKGIRKDRTTYSIKGVVPINKMGVKATEIALDTDTPTRNRRAKQIFLDQIPEDGVIYEFSQERYEFDPEGAWVLHEETVATNPDSGRPEAHVNSRRLGVLLDVAAQLYKPEAICKEAFEHHGDKLCCQRQIAAILDLDLGHVCNELEALEPGCTEIGCTPDLLLDFAKQNS